MAPAAGPSLISRVLTVEYTQQWSNWAFPKGRYTLISSTPNLGYFNQYGDSNVSADRLAFIDGNIDNFLDPTYHSNDAPDRYSTDLHPDYLIAGAGHGWIADGILDLDTEPQFIREAHL